MSELGKPGSSRRKGDEYQDITALRLALDNYISRNSFRIFLEYEEAGNFDDIVLIQGTSIVAYQVKYAVNALEVYEPRHFVDSDSPVSLKRFADSWKKLREHFPTYRLTVSLLSNRGLNADIVDLITPEGKFTQELIEDRRRGDAKRLRSELASASGLDANLFAEFLTDFQFILRQPTLMELEQHIQIVLLDKELGLSDDTIYLDLKEAIKKNAIFTREAITAQSIDRLLERLQTKLLIPQVFPLNQDHFVKQQSLSVQLDKVLPQINGGYLIVTGLPGSGKSTSLTTYCDELSDAAYEVFKYYCFVGVNDNAQRMRVQAESLRANLLSELHRRYPHILKRRFDFSERNFLECLTTLAKFFVDQNRRLIILLDGLDHAERLEPEVRETVISALPAEIPEGMTIVVGTQELHRWPHFLRKARDRPESHIEVPLFTVAETQEYLEKRRGISGLSLADIVDVHKNCEGLPLYLRYAAEIIISSKSLREAVESLAPALGGNIRNYYGLLWDEFERIGMGEARQLCVVMACVHFSLHREELYTISTLGRPNFEDAYKCIRHLLRDYDGKLSVFHNSFREFVISQVNEDWIKETKQNICSFLKAIKNTARWFCHVFRYCYDVEDHKYVLDEVNAEFVDRALFHCRPSSEILDAIHWAIESAFKLQDIVQLSRLGAFNFRTTERLEHNLNRALLADALIALGREQDVISFAYSSEADHWLVENRIALAVMSRLAEEGKMTLGMRLFDVFTKEFRGIDSDNRGEWMPQVLGIARCLGIYVEKQARPLRWLARFKMDPDILEQKDLYAPGYAPHLAAYIDALVRFSHTDKWNRLKRVKVIFPNDLVRYLLIRTLARYNLIDDLRAEISEYWKQYHPPGNVELAFYAAKAGMPASDVAAIAGTIGAPKTKCPDYIPPSDPTFRHYANSFIVMAYEDNEYSYASLCETIGKTRTLWSSALQHLLKASYCIGSSFRSSEHDWYEEARASIAILVQAEQGDGERIIESIDLLRKALPLTIGLLTEQIQKRFPKHLGEWVEGLASLRDSLLWNTHFGISESRQDYDFELDLWETLAKISSVRPWLVPILRSCAQAYKKSTKLKGGCRSDHFVRLSAIMAKCRMRDDAEEWLHYGIQSSLIYGYHKDVTILYLIDILKLLNRQQPELALERCARVLSMIRWMPHLTDNRETHWFAQSAFKVVLEVNRRAAFDLLKQFSRTIARWQMQDCLEEYLLSATEGDPEYFWCLTELFSNHDSEDGAHCKQIMGTRRHIVDLVQKACSGEMPREFEKRFRHFVLTEITPRHWPQHLKVEFNIPTDMAGENVGNAEPVAKSPSEFKLDDKNITKEGLAEKCRISFPEFLTTIEKLKNQNAHFYEREIIEKALRHHISAAKSPAELAPIKKYVEDQGRWQHSDIIECLAERFDEFGDQDNAIACFGLAYTCEGDWFRWRKNSKYLAAAAARDRQTAKAFVLKECYESTRGSGGGYATPPIAAAGLDVLNEPGMLEDVFNDYLVHCESMFAQLPQDDEYAWLKEYKDPTSDTNQLILDLILYELSTPEIDHGERLIRAVAGLAIARPGDALPVLMSRMRSASGRILRRLLTVLYSIALQSPELLVSHQREFVQLLERKDFFCCQTALHILRCVDHASTLETSVASSVQHTERNYSSSIYHSSYRMASSPTPEFDAFLKRNTQFDFYRQVMLMERILKVPSGNLVAAIEERLIGQGWSMEDEWSRVKDDWYGHAHPQGWPVVWITTEFQELVTDALWSILDEAAKKLKLDSEQIYRLWLTIQPADPEYVLRGVVPRPSDIRPLHVSDKNAWFSELDELNSMNIESDLIPDVNGGWITVFENRRMSQEEHYNVPYKQEIAQRAFLVPQQVYGGSDALDSIKLTTEVIVPDPMMAVTIQQAKIELKHRGHKIYNAIMETLPLIAEHQNPPTFIGYSNICTLTSFIIDEYDLSFEGFDLVGNNEVVAKYEAWQEGYQDESYSREKISSGVRLRVRRDILSSICGRHRKLLCIRVEEKRECYKSIHDQEPEDRRDSKRYILYHL